MDRGVPDFNFDVYPSDNIAVAQESSATSDATDSPISPGEELPKDVPIRCPLLRFQRHSF